MLWLIVTILSYLLFSVVALVDKYLLKGSIPSPHIYSFYVGIFGIFSLVLIPFGFLSIPGFEQIILALLAGAVSIFALFAFYSALQKFEVSRAVPAIGGILPLFTLVLVFIFSGGKEILGTYEILAFVFLISGSVLITLKKEKLITLKSIQLSVLAAFLFSLTFVLSKFVYLEQPFWSGFIWMRLGAFLAGVCFLFTKQVRAELFTKRVSFKRKTGGIFLGNQVLGGSAFILQNWAIALVPLGFLAFVNALEGIKYVFLLVFAIFFSFKFPQILKEEISNKIIFQKLFAILLITIGLLILALGGAPPQAEKITWGINFSQKHVQDLGLNWQECYLSLLDDLEVKNIKLLTHWDLIEIEQGKYNFEDLDWQIRTAEEKGVKLLLVLGRKTGRWPECHIPEWAKDLDKKQQEERVLKLIEKTVLNYRDNISIITWQVENEPFFIFGECPETDEEFVKKEIDLVKSLDSSRQIIISDSGEFSFWIRAARLGDMVGTTMYLKTWFTPAFLNKWQRFKHLGKYVSTPLPPSFYWTKAQIIKNLFNKKVICVELQAEPWGPYLLYDSPLEEQEKTMDLEQFRKNIEFAKNTGLDEFYLWGAEWWYWLKTEKNQSQIWQEAKLLFINR
ncbi:hypothetical protein AMJ49_05665 [Parcubacteria bacterium DG_74_2]|nr:MAG: hypothetical protein AMJ49_05665 [Parcubacteria bacterium DG_74_2]